VEIAIVLSLLKVSIIILRVVVVFGLSLRQVRTCDDIDHFTNIALVPACCG
jgi:hypothetical protein